ncbi:MAG: hypothetical protein ACJAQ3_002389, partial [Planctomycetota bacterium]
MELRMAKREESRAGTPTGFVVGMVCLGVFAVGGQVPGLFAVMGFSDERASWDAKASAREELTSEVDQLQQLIQTSRIESEGLTPVLNGRKAELAALREALGEAESSREDAFAQRAAAVSRASSADAAEEEAQAQVVDARTTKEELQT